MPHMSRGQDGDTDQSKRKDIGSGYSSFAENWIKFTTLGELPGSFHLERLDDGHGIEAAMIAHDAHYHQTAGSSTTPNYREHKRKHSIKPRGMRNNLYKRTRAHSHSSSTEEAPETCFFCEQPTGTSSESCSTPNGQTCVPVQQILVIRSSPTVLDKIPTTAEKRPSQQDHRTQTKSE